MVNSGNQEQRYNAWVSKAIAKHSIRFSYIVSKFAFRNQKTIIPVLCAQHGEFFTTGDKHLSSEHGGCPQCRRKAQSTSKSAAYHEAYTKWLFDYLPSNLEVIGQFKSPSEPLVVRCKTHGTTKTTTAIYLKNNKTCGCDACAREKTTQARMLTPEAVKAEIAGNLPSLVTFVGLERGKNGTKVRASCSRHGEFITTKGTIAAAKYACPECKRENAGYTSHRLARLIEAEADGEPCQIGVMEVEVFGITAIKVGVTIRTLSDRYKWYLRRIYWSATLPERLAYVLESRLHRRFSKVRDDRIRLAGMRGGKRWEGDTEVYLESTLPEILDFARRQDQDLSHEDIDFRSELSMLNAEISVPDLTREKSLANLPQEVEGLDPKTNEVVIAFASLSAAARAGYRNLSLVLNPSSSRMTSGGLLWRRKE